MISVKDTEDFIYEDDEFIDQEPDEKFDIELACPDMRRSSASKSRDFSSKSRPDDRVINIKTSSPKNVLELKESGQAKKEPTKERKKKVLSSRTKKALSRSVSEVK